jgi:hypothetical protein
VLTPNQSAEMEEGLSRLKLAIKALDDQVKNSAAAHEKNPLAQTG